MAPVDFKSQRMNKNEARKRVAELASLNAPIHFTKHALEELEADGLSTLDAVNVIKSTASKILGEGEFRGGGYTYRLETNSICIVISFDPDGNSLNVITAWDKRKKKGTR